MSVKIRLPDLGTTVDSVRLERWCVKVGDPVKRGDILAEIQTDKALSELESVATGVVLTLLVMEGEDVQVGDPIVEIGSPEEFAAMARTRRPPAAQRPDQAAPRATVPSTVAQKPARASHPKLKMSLRAYNLAVEHGVDAQSLVGTGEDGRITEEDVLRAVAEPSVRTRRPPLTFPELEERDFLLDLYRKMLLIRQFEERVKFLFLEGMMPGTIHQYQGQEAVAVGVCAALNADDIITSTHRPHGHAIAKGLSAESLLHELFGKKTGCCRAKGGSMHVGDLDKGMVPAIAIVGGNVPLATGAALAFKMRGESRVAVSFMGDGAVNEGAFHEAVNMGAIWKLPILYVVENNRYAASTRAADSTALKKISDRALGYGIPGVTIDGNDVIAVYRTTREAVARARRGDGPTLLEAVTYRITGHSRRDPCNYQPQEEREKARKQEPLARFAAYLLERQYASEGELDEVRRLIDEEIESAVQSAMQGEDPKPEDALNDVFV